MMNIHSLLFLIILLVLVILLSRRAATLQGFKGSNDINVHALHASRFTLPALHHHSNQYQANFYQLTPRRRDAVSGNG
jgi:hypothetical protein